MVQDEISLTPHQQSVVSQGVDYLKEDGNRILLIQGSAGTGKTTLVRYLVAELTKELYTKKGRTYSAVMTAPTNKAVEVLREKSDGEDDIYSEFCTLHSALQLKYNVDEARGIEQYVPDPTNKERRLVGPTILVVDEASMIGSDLLHYIDANMEENKQLKVIYIGDNKQLPPINETTSPVFLKGYQQLELNEIIRQAAENPIISVSNNIYLLNSYIDQVTPQGLGFSFTKDYQRIIRHFVENRHDTDIRFIAYTNRRVEEFNTLVRREIYHHPNKIEEGETIIFDRPYQVDFATRYANNEEVEINSLEIQERQMDYPIDKEGHTDTIRLKVYQVNDSFPILHEESDFLFQDLLSQLRRKAINKDLYWRDYFSARDAFVAFKHRYAITVHKAQGSTYREVFIDYDDINRNQSLEERSKLIYTAITRASRHLTVLTSKLRDGR